MKRFVGCQRKLPRLVAEARPDPARPGDPDRGRLAQLVQGSYCMYKAPGGSGRRASGLDGPERGAVGTAAGGDDAIRRTSLNAQKPGRGT